MCKMPTDRRKKSVQLPTLPQQHQQPPSTERHQQQQRRQQQQPQQQQQQRQHQQQQHQHQQQQQQRQLQQHPYMIGYDDSAPRQLLPLSSTPPITNLNRPTTTTAWRRADDKEQRKVVFKQIIKCIQNEMKLELVARRYEKLMYLNAASMEHYIDTTTIRTRILQLIQTDSPTVLLHDMFALPPVSSPPSTTIAPTSFIRNNATTSNTNNYTLQATTHHPYESVYPTSPFSPFYGGVIPADDLYFNISPTGGTQQQQLQQYQQRQQPHQQRGRQVVVADDASPLPYPTTTTTTITTQNSNNNNNTNFAEIRSFLDEKQYTDQNHPDSTSFFTSNDESQQLLPYNQDLFARQSLSSYTGLLSNINGNNNNNTNNNNTAENNDNAESRHDDNDVEATKASSPLHNLQQPILIGGGLGVSGGGEDEGTDSNSRRSYVSNSTTALAPKFERMDENTLMGRSSTPTTFSNNNSNYNDNNQTNISSDSCNKANINDNSTSNMNRTATERRVMFSADTAVAPSPPITPIPYQRNLQHSRYGLNPLPSYDDAAMLASLSPSIMGQHYHPLDDAMDQSASKRQRLDMFASPSSTSFAIYRRHQRLLELHHAANCTHFHLTGGTTPCPVSIRCAEMKQLWAHMGKCKSNNCGFPHCFSSRALLGHFRKCRKRDCIICAPVKEQIAMGITTTTTAPTRPRPATQSRRGGGVVGGGTDISLLYQSSQYGNNYPFETQQQRYSRQPQQQMQQLRSAEDNNISRRIADRSIRAPPPGYQGDIARPSPSQQPVYGGNSYTSTSHVLPTPSSIKTANAETTAGSETASSSKAPSASSASTTTGSKGTMAPPSPSTGFIMNAPATEPFSSFCDNDSGQQPTTAAIAPDTNTKGASSSSSSVSGANRSS